MVRFTTTMLKFDSHGEKTGWTYIAIPSAIAVKIKDTKSTFRVKGSLDGFPINKLALLPMGHGDFILSINATIRKKIRKQAGAKLRAVLEADNDPLKPPPDFLECLQDEPGALKYFKTLPKSHQNYFIKWIENAKTAPTISKRIALTIEALSKGQRFGEMLRSHKSENYS